MADNNSAIQRDAIGGIVLKTGYPEFMARSIWQEIGQADDEIRAAFTSWLRDEPVPDIRAGELSLDELTKDGQTVPACLAVLAHYRRDPHFAANYGRFDTIISE